MTVVVVPYSPSWPQDFAKVAQALEWALADLATSRVEHVGSTAVPGLAAKPILDIDVIVEAQEMSAAVAALETLGYVHRGDLGVVGREAFHAPDDDPRRHVYVCQRGTLNVRNHLAVRDVLRARDDLRDEYGAVKTALAAEPDLDIDTYIARKSAVLQKVLAVSDLTTGERREILRLNDPTAVEAKTSRQNDIMSVIGASEFLVLQTLRAIGITVAITLVGTVQLSRPATMTLSSSPSLPMPGDPRKFLAWTQMSTTVHVIGSASVPPSWR